MKTKLSLVLIALLAASCRQDEPKTGADCFLKAAQSSRDSSELERKQIVCRLTFPEISIQGNHKIVDSPVDDGKIGFPKNTPDQYIWKSVQLIRENKRDELAVLYKEIQKYELKAPEANNNGGRKIEPGDYFEGYRFKGDDPSKAENWEAIQR